VNDILRVAKFLRDANDQNVRNFVYFNRDVSKEEATVLYLKRQSRRDLLSTRPADANDTRMDLDTTSLVQPAADALPTPSQNVEHLISGDLSSPPPILQLPVVSDT